MLGAPSTLRSYPLVCLLDDALDVPADLPECSRLDDESDGAYAARVKERNDAQDAQVKDFHARFARAEETGEWSGLIKPGTAPAIFTVRQVPGSKWRRFEALSANRTARERTALAFRLAVERIENHQPAHAVSAVEHLDESGRASGLGKILAEHVVDDLDLISKQIVDLVGYAVLRQRGAPLGK